MGKDQKEKREGDQLAFALCAIPPLTGKNPSIRRVFERIALTLTPSNFGLLARFSILRRWSAAWRAALRAEGSNLLETSGRFRTVLPTTVSSIRIIL